jgi:hypothetical protein
MEIANRLQTESRPRIRGGATITVSLSSLQACLPAGCLNGNYFIAIFSLSRKFYPKSLAAFITAESLNRAKSLRLLDFPSILI